MGELGRSMSQQPPHKKIAQKEPFYDLCFDWRLNLVLEGGKVSKEGTNRLQVLVCTKKILHIYIYGIHRTCMMNLQNHHSLFLLYFFAFKSAWPPTSSDSFPSEIFGSSQFNNFQNPRSPPKKRRNVALTRKQPCTCTTPWSRCRVVSISFLR